jgi:ferredoxin
VRANPAQERTVSNFRRALHAFIGARWGVERIGRIEEDRMKVIVDTGKCMGHARCVAVAPEVFTLNSDGYNAEPEWPVAEGQEQKARRGVNACPERAMRLVED